MINVVLPWILFDSIFYLSINLDIGIGNLLAGLSLVNYGKYATKECNNRILGQLF